MNTRTIKGASLIVVVAMVAMVFAGVQIQAAPAGAYTRYGDGGANVAPASTTISAWIDGVEYGLNTSSVTGTYTIETAGDDIFDTTMKIGGLNGETVRYVLGTERLMTGQLSRFATQNAAFTAWGITLGALTEAAAGSQARLLKINNVSSQSTLESAAGVPNDYIVIWNPAGATIDITTYSIAVGAAAAQPIIAGDIWTYRMYAWTTNPVPVSGFIAINMAKWGGLATAGNSIKLIHTATGFIVDRVEYGNIADPQNTIMTNATAPGSAQQIRRTAAGADTNSCSVDFSAPVAQWLPQDLIAPTVNAGSDETRNALFSTTAGRVTPASITDTGGSGVSAVVSWTSVPAGVVFGTPASLTTTISAPAGNGVTYTIRLTGYDNAGNSAWDEFTLLWDTVGPTVNAGSDETRNAVFSSTAGRVTPASASATGAAITTYAWTSAPAGVIFGTPAALTTTISAPAGEVTYTVRLTVTDAATNAVFDEFTLLWDTVGPTVNAGSDETKDAIFTTTVPADRTVISSASATGAPISTYAWTAAPAGVVFGTPAALTTTITAAVGVYTVTLTVTDAAGNVVADSFQLTWNPPATAWATATGPTGTGAVGITITYTYSVAPAPTSVDLYYTLDTVSPWTWVWAVNDAPVDGSIAYVLPGNGVYSFYASAVGGGSVEPNPPAPTDAPEIGTYTVGSSKLFGPSAPLNVRIWLVGSQALATAVNISWNAVAGATGYNIYRGTTPYSIDFGTPLNGGVPIVALQYVDAGAIAGSAQYYYSVRAIAGGVESASSATVGKYTMPLQINYNVFGIPLELFPERTDYLGHLMCDWRLIRATSVDRVPNATTIFTFTYATQSWKSRSSTTPDAIAHVAINPQEDGIEIFMQVADSYTWLGTPAEQVRKANFTGVTPLAAPANFKVRWAGVLGGSNNDVRLTWDAVPGADHYHVYTSTTRSLANFNFVAAPAYSGVALTWDDAGANTTVGAKYYIVVAVDGDGDLGDSAYAVGKYTRSLLKNYNVFTTPFEVFRGRADYLGHQLCDWRLVRATSQDRIPLSTTIFTFTYATQSWKSRSSTTPDAIAHVQIPTMGSGVEVFLSDPSTYTWLST
ncbi:MAG: hypothetical protein V1934_06460 [Methanobacteriota archaeon]